MIVGMNILALTLNDLGSMGFCQRSGRSALVAGDQVHQ